MNVLLKIVIFILFCSNSFAQGNLVLIGGGKRPESVMKQIVALQKDGPFLIVPMASGIPDTVGWEHRDMFKEFGAKNVENMLIQKSDSINTELIKKFESAGGIWFSGGDQNRLMQFIGNTALKSAIHKAYVNGAVIAGTSAGTAIQSEWMITGDERFPISERVYFGQIRKQNTILEPGLGLLKGMIVDQHFIRRGRSNRLITSLLDEPVSSVAGIDESTALWFKPNGNVEVIGDGQVLIWEKTEFSVVVKKDSLLGAKNIIMHLLPSGSKFEWKNKTIKNIELSKN